MQQMFRLMVAAVLAVAFTHFSSSAMAQGEVKQIKLTEKQVQGFIAAYKGMSGGGAGGGSDKAGAKGGGGAGLEPLAKKHGFASLDEYDDVEANILMIVDGIDAQTKAFTEPPAQIRQRIEELKADKSTPQKERDTQMAELTEALKTAKPVQYRENIELVKKYLDKIDAVLN